jgi:hypothetical protein
MALPGLPFGAGNQTKQRNGTGPGVWPVPFARGTGGLVLGRLPVHPVAGRDRAGAERHRDDADDP